MAARADGKKLTRAVVVQAALDVLDRDGIDGLTVRALAATLKVKAPALYWHVRDKQDLLDEMGTEIWRRVGDELAALPPDITWDDEATAFAEITRDALLSHRDGAKVFSGTYLTDGTILARQESSLGRWLAQGFTVADVVRAFTLLNSFVIGFCVEQQAVDQADDDRYSLETRNERVGAEAHPLTAAAGAELAQEADIRFADLLGLVVETIGHMRDAHRGTSTPSAAPRREKHDG